MSDDIAFGRVLTLVGGPWSRGNAEVHIPAAGDSSTLDFDGSDTIRIDPGEDLCDRQDAVISEQWTRIADLQLRVMELERALLEMSAVVAVRDTIMSIPPPLPGFDDTDVVDEYELTATRMTITEQAATMAELVRKANK